MRLRALLIMVVLFTPAIASAIEYKQGETNAELFCTAVQDTAPTDLVTSGAVMQIAAQQVGGANDTNCLASDGTFATASASCGWLTATYRGANGVGGMWSFSGVTIPNDAERIIVTCRASDSSVVPYDYPITVSGDWPIFNVVDATNEGGNQDPTTTSFDTDYPDTIDRTTGSEKIWLTFPRTSEDSRQSASCNVQGLTVEMTAFDTATKVVTVTTMPAAPDYRCVFREAG